MASDIDDIIEALFISQWDKVSTLNSIMAADPAFNAFIIRHVNEAYSMEGGETILKNAVNQCPAGSENLCRIIRERLKN